MPRIIEIALSNAGFATLLALLAVGISKLVRRPVLTHGLWLLVLLKLVMPPIIPVQTGWNIPKTSPSVLPDIELSNDFGVIGASGELSDEPMMLTNPERQRRAFDTRPSPAVRAGGDAEAFLVLDPPDAVTNPRPLIPVQSVPRAVENRWLAVLIPVWLAGSVLVFAWTSWHTYRFHRWLRFARLAPAEAQNQVRELARRLGLKRCPVLCLVPGAVSPMIWTIGRGPRLLFPARLVERLDRDQRAALFVHELAHLKRRDHWVRILELIALVLYWWHPVVWWARRELHEAEEQCCDAWVVWALSGRSRAYALALLHTVDFFSHARPTLPLAASGIGQVPHLRRRLTMIMQEKTPRSLTWAGCVAMLALGLLLPLTPVLGQEKPKDDAPSDKSDRDQQIETLKKAIKILEAQKLAEQQNQDLQNLKKITEIKAVQVEVDTLTKQVDANRKALKVSEDKLAAAKQRLNKLTGKKEQVNKGQSNPYELKLNYNLQPLDVQWFTNVQPFDYQKIYQLDPLQLQKIDQGNELGIPFQFQQHQPGQDTKTDLERKVEKLLKEVEELKRELQKHKQTNAAEKQPQKGNKTPQENGKGANPFQEQGKQQS